MPAPSAPASDQVLQPSLKRDDGVHIPDGGGAGRGERQRHPRGRSVGPPGQQGPGMTRYALDDHSAAVSPGCDPGDPASRHADLWLQEDAQPQGLKRQPAQREPLQRVHGESRRPATANGRRDIVRAHLADRGKCTRPASVALQRARRADDHPPAQPDRGFPQLAGQAVVKRAAEHGPARRRGPARPHGGGRASAQPEAWAALRQVCGSLRSPPSRRAPRHCGRLSPQ